MLKNPFRIRTVTALLGSFLAMVSPALRAQPAVDAIDAAQVVLSSTDPQFQRLIDLDGDPRMDALGMRGGTGITQLRLYRNQGDGSFLTTWNHTVSWSGFATTSSPLEVGDFDGDGQRDDFAITAGLELRLFRGAALGATQASFLPLTDTIRDLCVRDLDQNGIDDLVALFPSFITVALNPLGSNPGFLIHPVPSTIQDEEILIVHRGGGLHSIFGGAAHLVFTPGSGLSPSATSGLGYPGHALHGDLDGDGDEDGIVFDANGQYRRAIQGPPGVFMITGPHDGGPASSLIDLDGDGDLDAVGSRGGTSNILSVPNHDLSRFEFCKNDGSGHFGAPRPLRSCGAQRLAGVSDLDGDGDLDFLAGRSLYFGRSSSVLARPVVPANPNASSASLVNFLDIDDDGDLDLQLFDPASPVVYRNDGSGQMVLASVDVLVAAPASPWYGTAVADWNQDGRPDFISASPPNAYVAYNLGGGAFSWRATPAGVGAVYEIIARPDAIADLDNDGDLDCVGRVLGSFFTSLAIAFDQGSNNFSQASATFIDEHCVGTADLDGDGRIDLVTRDLPFATPSTGRLSWLRHAPAQSFANPSVIAPAVASKGRPLLHDMDLDGDIDIVAFVSGVGHVVFTNDGSGGFTQSVLAPSAAPLADATMRYFLSDLDGDGIDDLLAAPAPDARGCSFILHGTGAGFVPGSDILAFLPTLCADLDGDGDDDFVEGVGGFLTSNLLIDGPNTGSRRQYGIGTAGSSGLVPTLGASGPFREGGVSTLRLRNARGGATCFFVLSTIPAQLPDYPLPGLTSYVDPLAPTSLVWPPLVLGGTPGSPGTGSADLSFNLPIGVAGLEIHHQVFLLDPQGPSGISASEGLVIRYGL